MKASPLIRLMAVSCFAFAILASGTAIASPSNCKVQVQASKELGEQIERAGRLATENLKALEAIEALMASRSWKPNVPIGPQMTSEESAKFAENTAKTKAYALAQLIESKRERDVRVFARMARLADQTARYGLELPRDTNSEDYKLLQILAVLPNLMPIELEAMRFPSLNSDCNLENALKIDAKKALDDAEHVSDFDVAMDGLKELKKKYGVFPESMQQLGDLPNALKMSASDRRHFEDEIHPILSEFSSHLVHAQNLYRIALLEEVSKLMVASMRQDQYEAAGDFDYSGTTWKSLLKQGKITEAQNERSGVINLINDRIPAAIVGEWDAISKGTPDKD